MIDDAATGAQDIGVTRNRLVDVQDPVSALPIRHLPSTAGDVIEPCREIGQMRAHQDHLAGAVLVAIGDFEALYGMVPQNAPTRALGHGQARDFGAILKRGDKLACGCGKGGGQKEEGAKPPSEPFAHGRSASGIEAPISSK